MSIKKNIPIGMLSLMNGESGKDSKLKRDSKSNITSWKNRLSAQEIDLIKEGTKEISDLFYTQADWE